MTELSPAPPAKETPAQSVRIRRIARRSDALVREEPDEEEDDEEDEGNVTDDEGDDDEEDGRGYSVRVCRLCQW